MFRRFAVAWMVAVAVALSLSLFVGGVLAIDLNPPSLLPEDPVVGELSVEDLQAQIAALLAQITALQEALQRDEADGEAQDDETAMPAVIVYGTIHIVGFAPGEFQSYNLRVEVSTPGSARSSADIYSFDEGNDGVSFFYVSALLSIPEIGGMIHEGDEVQTNIFYCEESITHRVSSLSRDNLDTDEDVPVLQWDHDVFLQTLHFLPGWNPVGLNVLPDEPITVGDIKDGAQTMAPAIGLARNRFRVLPDDHVIAAGKEAVLIKSDSYASFTIGGTNPTPAVMEFDGSLWFSNVPQRPLESDTVDGFFGLFVDHGVLIYIWPDGTANSQLVSAGLTENPSPWYFYEATGGHGFILIGFGAPDIVSFSGTPWSFIQMTSSGGKGAPSLLPDDNGNPMEPEALAASLNEEVRRYIGPDDKLSTTWGALKGLR